MLGETFLDDVYEASFIPEKWPGVLAVLASSVEAWGGYLFTVNGGAGAWVSTPEIASLMEAFMASEFAANNVRARRAEALGHPGFVTDLDILTAEELDAEPLYRDFLRPNGIGWATGTHIALPTGDVLSFNMERRFDRGPVERHFVAALDAVRPHLARAAMVGARLQLTKADTAVKTLSMLGMPAAVLGSRGQMLAVNQLLESLVPTLVQDRQDRLHLADVTADQILGQTLSHVREKRGPGVQSFPVSDDAGSPVAIAHVLPVTGDARDLFARSSTVLVIMPVDAGRAPSAGLLRALFDLTTGEARVALALADGRTIGEAAQELGISRETARTHLRSIFAKTGVSRQSGLMRKMSGVTLPGLREAEVRDDDRDIL